MEESTGRLVIRPYFFSSESELLISNEIFSTESSKSAVDPMKELCLSIPSPEISVGTHLSGWISHFEPSDDKTQIFFTLIENEADLIEMSEALINAKKQPLEQDLVDGCYVLANHPEHGWNRAKFLADQNTLYFIDFGSSMKNENLKQRVINNELIQKFKKFSAF